jgi:hypothetical protein
MLLTIDLRVCPRPGPAITIFFVSAVRRPDPATLKQINAGLLNVGATEESLSESNRAKAKSS